MRKKIITENNYITDKKTGEILEQNTKQKIISTEPEFLKMYFDDLSYFLNLKINHRVFLSILKNCLTYKNILTLNYGTKKIISADVGVSINTINKLIDKCTKYKLIIRLERGVYLVNPLFFGRGTWKDLQEIRLNIIYKENERGIKTDFIYINAKQLKIDIGENTDFDSLSQE